MQEFGFSVRTYSTMTDEELDNIISVIKSQMPNAGILSVYDLCQCGQRREGLAQNNFFAQRTLVL